jgi:hypothetical protein
MVDLAYRVDMQDGVSATAKTITQAAKQMGQAVATAGDVVETSAERVRRSSATFESLSRRYDDNARAAAAKAKAERDLARATDGANAEVAKGLASREQADRLIEAARVKTTAYVASVERQIAAEQRRNGTLASGSAALSVQARALTEFGAANDNTANRMQRLGYIAGQAGFQIQDFAVQVAGGQNAMVAFAQQAPQLLGVFGTTGAIAGAVVAIGAITANLLMGGDAAKKFTSAVEAQDAGLRRATASADRWREGLASEAMQVQDLTTYYQSLSQERRQYETRAAQRDEAALLEQKRAFEEEAIGRLRRLSQGMSNDVTDMQGLANLYPAGSAERDAMLSAPELAALRDRAEQARTIVAEFTTAVQAHGADTVEALSTVTSRLRDLAGSASDPMARMLREAAAEMDKLDPKARGLAEAGSKLEIVMQALGLRLSGIQGGLDALSAASERARQRLVDLQGVSARQLAEPEVALTNARKILQALEQGGTEAAEALRRQLTAADTLETRVQGWLSTRADSLRAVAKAEAENLRLQGDTEAAAQRMNAVEIEIAADRRAREGEVRNAYRETDKLDEEFRTRSEARRKADAASARENSAARAQALRDEAAAARDAMRVYDSLRRDGNTGLLYGTDTDDNAAREIQRALKGTQFDPAVRKRAQDQIERDLKASQERQERLIERSTDSIVDYAGDSFADLFDKNGTGWAGMLDTFEATARRTFARIAAEAIIRPVISPIVSSVVGGASGAGGTGQAASGAAGMLGNMSMSDYASLGMKISGGSALGSTGFAYLDEVLSTPVWTSGSSLGSVASIQTSATTSALSGMGTGQASTIGGLQGSTAYTNTALYGPATPAAVQTAGYNSISAGQALSGGLSIAGGLYGIYQGAQIGGAKGWATGGAGVAGVVGGGAGLMAAAGVGGAAMAGIAAVAPYAAAVLAIAAMFLDGQKPSDKTGVYWGNLAEDSSSVGGLEGKRFSQENRDRAQQIGEQIKSLGSTLKGALGVDTVPFNYSVSVGDRDGIAAAFQGQNNHYSADEAGTRQLIQDMTLGMVESMRGLASAEVQSIIGSSGGNVETLLGNLDWYNSVYKTMVAESETPTTQWQQQQDTLLAPIDAAIAKATELGLSEAKLTEVRNKALQSLADQRSATLEAIAATDQQRQATANGVTALTQQLGNWNAAAQAEVTALNEQLVQLGLSQEQRDPWLQERWRTLDTERGAMLRQQAAAQASNDNGLWDRRQAASGAGETLDGSRWDYERKAFAEWQAAVADGMTDLTLLAETQNAERLKIERDYVAKVTALNEGFQDRIFAATTDTSTREGALAAFDRQAAKERLDVARQAGADLVLLEQAQAAERAEIIKRYAEQEKEALRNLGGSIRAWIDNVRGSANGGLSPQDQLKAAQDAFGRDLALARGGDQEAQGRITGTADNLLNAGRQMYASGQEFQTLRDWILSSMESLPATMGYDAMILDELRKLGGTVHVEVELATFRVITEQLDALTEAERKLLIQSETVLRTVEERLGRALTAQERSALIQGEVVLRAIEQSLGRDLTAAERAGLVSSAQVLRSIEQAIGRNLTAAERAGLVSDASVIRSIEQRMGRSLTAQERAGLVAGETVTRLVEQSLGRNLTAEERASLVAGDTVRRLVEQTLGRSLTAEERAGLVQSAIVQRRVEEALGRTLTAAELAALIQSGAIQRSISQILLPLTPQEQAALIPSATVIRDVKQSVETTETVQISRSIDDKLSGLLLAQLGLLSDMRGFLQRVAGADGGVTIRLGQDANVLFMDMRGILVTLDRHMAGAYGGLPIREANADGVTVRARGWAHNEPGAGVVKFATGGVFGGGRILTGPTDAVLADGTAVQAGEAGAEAVLPLGRGRNGRLGVEARITALPPMPTSSGDTAALQAEVRALRQLVEQLLRQQAAEAARQAQADAQAQQAREQQAEGIEDMADSNRRLAEDPRRTVGKRAGAR